jgi:hypothetical protein
MKKKILVGLVSLASPYCFAGSAEVSCFTPESILPAGVDSAISINPYTGESGNVRKGTVAAMLNNVARLNQLLVQEETPECKQEIMKISTAINQLIPSLQIIGVFDLFEPIHWIGNGEQSGRILVLSLYFKHYPEKCTPALKEQLFKVKENIFSPYLREQLDLL